MSFSSGVLMVNNLSNYRRIKEILKYIDEHPSEEGRLAKKDYRKHFFISIFLVVGFMLPVYMIGAFFLCFAPDITHMPEGATREVSGVVSVYSDIILYTDNGQIRELQFDDCNIDKCVEYGGGVTIYFDENDNVVSAVSDKKMGMTIVAFYLLVFVGPIVVVLFYCFVGIRIFAKHWYNYSLWYQREIINCKKAG